VFRSTSSFFSEHENEGEDLKTKVLQFVEDDVWLLFLFSTKAGKQQMLMYIVSSSLAYGLLQLRTQVEDTTRLFFQSVLERKQRSTQLLFTVSNPVVVVVSALSFLPYVWAIGDTNLFHFAEYPGVLAAGFYTLKVLKSTINKSKNNSGRLAKSVFFFLFFVFTLVTRTQPQVQGLLFCSFVEVVWSIISGQLRSPYKDSTSKNILTLKEKSVMLWMVGLFAFSVGAESLVPTFALYVMGFSIMVPLTWLLSIYPNLDTMRHN